MNRAPNEILTDLCGFANHYTIGGYCFWKLTHNPTCPVSWGHRIHRLHLCRGVQLPPYACPGYDTKQSNGEVQVMLELWGMQSTPSMLSLQGAHWPGVVAPDSSIYALNRTKLCTYAKLNCLKLNCFWH